MEKGTCTTVNSVKKLLYCVPICSTVPLFHHFLIPSPPHCSVPVSISCSLLAGHVHSFNSPDLPFSLHPPDASNLPFFPHYLTALPKYTPVLTSLISSAFTWTSLPTSSSASHHSPATHSICTGALSLFHCQFISIVTCSAVFLFPVIPAPA